MSTKYVVVLPYDEAWKNDFENIKAELMQVLDGLVMSIEHVGSTSVSGLSAKPIIDIDVVIEGAGSFEKVKTALETIGYRHEGDLGIPGREAFKYEGKIHLRKHHLYVCSKDASELKRHISFRNYLRTHPEAVDEYSRVKEEGAKLYPNDIDGYINHKSPFIEGIYRLISDNQPLFYNEYEQFYKMTEDSKAFKSFCQSAFGEDFSQDGFSDINQINRILEIVPEGSDIHVLDVGCGNGKMLGYVQKKTGAYIHGFDYSQNAINTAKTLFAEKAEFRQGLIGEIDYPEGQFDVVTSMDSMYFAPDMKNFVSQIMRWLKKDGVLFVCYQEGDVMPKTENAGMTVFAKSLDALGIPYEFEDITAETYDLLKKKRETAVKYKNDFEAEGNMEWFDLLMIQTNCVTEPYVLFAEKMARYVYTVRKR